MKQIKRYSNGNAVLIFKPNMNSFRKELFGYYQGGKSQASLVCQFNSELITDYDFTFNTFNTIAKASLLKYSLYRKLCMSIGFLHEMRQQFYETTDTAYVITPLQQEIEKRILKLIQ